MPQPNDMSRSLATFDHDRTLIAVIEMSQSSWLVAGIVPGIERHPLKKLAVDEEALLRLMQRWQDEAAQAGRKIERIAVAFEAGRDLAGPLAAGTQYRSLCHSSDKCRCLTRAPTGEDRPAGYRTPEAGIPWLAARGARSLQHGGDPDHGGRRC